MRFHEWILCWLKYSLMFALIELLKGLGQASWCCSILRGQHHTVCLGKLHLIRLCYKLDSFNLYSFQMQCQPEYTQTTLLHTHYTTTHTLHYYTHNTLLHTHHTTTHTLHYYTHTTLLHTHNTTTHTLHTKINTFNGPSDVPMCSSIS